MSIFFEFELPRGTHMILSALFKMTRRRNSKREKRRQARSRRKGSRRTKPGDQAPMQLGFRAFNWGGARAGAGRPRLPGRRRMAHRKRKAVSRHSALHITIRVLDRVPNLRTVICLPLVEAALASWADRDGFRIVHYSIQSNHIHLIIEAPGGRPAVSRAMKGLKVSLTRKINALTGDTGTIWAERYHDVVVDSPRQARHAIAYVLNNGRRHHVRERWRRESNRVDPCSSAEAFDGWSTRIAHRRIRPPPVAPPKQWLLSVGWRQRGGGRIAPDYVPATH
jgi:REP element-mobilizing transposase RayT